MTINPCWYGAYDEPGRKWDVIAFNGGHWNSGGSRKEYWTAFEKALTGSLRAGNKVIRITTGPVPFGYNVKTSSRTDSGTAILPEAQWPSIRFAHANVEEENCGRNAGRMMTQNRWVEDILKKHPEVAVCDHWGFVYSQEKVGGSPFRPWWYGKDVHFGEEAMNKPLSGMIADLAFVLVGQKEFAALPAEYREFLHVGTKTYTATRNFGKEPPSEERYQEQDAAVTSARGAKPKKARKLEGFTEECLDASIVDYSSITFGNPIKRAKTVVEFARKDLDQHKKWLEEGEVPPEQYERAQRIHKSALQMVEAAKSAAGKP